MPVVQCPEADLRVTLHDPLLHRYCHEDADFTDLWEDCKRLLRDFLSVRAIRLGDVARFQEGRRLQNRFDRRRKHATPPFFDLGSRFYVGLTRAIDLQTYRDIDDDLVTIAGGFDD